MKKYTIALLTAVMIIQAAIFAQADEIKPKLCGIYEPQQTVTIEFDAEEDVVYCWYASDNRDFGYKKLPNSNKREMKLSSGYAQKWVKATVTTKSGETLETEPKQISSALERTSVYTIESDWDTFKNTPPENVFEFGGKEFILLDTFEPNNSKFLVMSKNSLTKHIYAQEGQGFDYMNGYLNGEFKEAGYLPQGILSHINYSAVWRMEPLMYPLTNNKETSVTAGISLPAVYEVKRYIDKIGIADSMGWWTRTPNASQIGSGSMVIAQNGINSSNKMWAYITNENEFGIRPIFYLDRSFFAEEKINYQNMGENVRSAIISEYNEDELGAYTQEEKDTIFRKGNIKISWEHLYDRKNPYISVVFCDAKDKQTQYEITIGNNEGYEKKISINRGDFVGNVYKISLFDLPYGAYDLTVSISAGNSQVFTRSQRVGYMTFNDDDTFMKSYSQKGYCDGLDTPLTEDYAKKSGVTLIRTGEEWHAIESEKGVYNFDILEQKIKKIEDMGAEPIILLAYSNPLYGAETVKGSLSTKELIDAFAAMGAAVAEHFPNVKYFEVYNEPNLGVFWNPPNYGGVDYSYLIKVTNEEIKKINPDAKIIGGVAADGGVGFNKYIFGKDAYPYMDAVSFHPYCYYNDGRTDDDYRSKVDGFIQQTLINGGFKYNIITEIGWPTYNDAISGSSEEKQAVELVKQYIEAEDKGIHQNAVYGLIDGGYDEFEKEHNFGVITRDGDPKKSYISNSTYMRLLSGAVYCAKIRLADRVVGYIYRKDGKPILVMWHEYGKADAGTNVSAAVTFDGQTVTAYDIYANRVQTAVSTVVLGNEPLYVIGLDEAWFKNILHGYETKIDDILSLSGQSDKKAYFADAISAVNACLERESVADETEAYELLDKCYKVAADILNAYKSGELAVSEKQLSSLFYAVHASGMIIANYYSASVDKASAQTACEYINIPILKNNLLANVNGRMPLTEAILDMANDYAIESKEISEIPEDNPSKAGFVKSREAIAKHLSDMAQLMHSAEVPTRNDLIIISPSDDQKPPINEAGEVAISVYNYGKTAFSGTLKLVSSDGVEMGSAQINELGTDENATYRINVPAQSDVAYADALILENGEVVKKENILIVDWRSEL